MTTTTIVMSRKEPSPSLIDIEEAAWRKLTARESYLATHMPGTLAVGFNAGLAVHAGALLEAQARVVELEALLREFCKATWSTGYANDHIQRIQVQIQTTTS